MRPEVREQVFPSETPQVLLRSDDRKPECVVGEKSLFKIVMYDILGIVFGVLKLFDDHELLLFQLLLPERGMHHDVRKDVQRFRYVGIKNSRIEACLFLRRERIQIAAKRFEALCYVPDAPPLGPLEHHVLDEMADPVLAQRLVSGTDVSPDADRNRTHMIDRLRHDTNAVIKHSFAVKGGDGLRGFGHAGNISISRWIVKESRSVHRKGHSES